MPFGLTNAPATCQALINNVLRAHLDIFVIAYLDDILVYSDNEQEHVQHVKTVLECLDKFELKLKPEKCEFHKEEVEFLGFVIGTKGVKVSPTKVEVVRNWPRPTNVKTVQKFLGFCNYLRRFIKNYSELTIPLTRLTRKDNPFKWGKEQENAYRTLKEACASPPVLMMFQPNKPVRINTDASKLAIGACLKQEKDGQWHPVEYYSRSFTPTEQRYDTHDLELAAVHRALMHWRVEAESCSELTVYSDHKNLTYFTTSKPLVGRQIRWSQDLGRFKFKILHVPGRENGIADALSRRDDLLGEKEKVIDAVLRQNEDGSLEPARQLNNLFQITNTVPEELQEAIIKQHHDDPVHGHPGIKRTTELIQRNYEFPGMKEKVTQYIKKCTDCQKNKHSTHAKYGEMQATEIPTAPWEDIAMDFVIGLPWSRDPVTRNSYNAILNVVCRLTKAAEMIPFRDDYSAEDLGRILVDRIVRYHGIPKTIISDRDKLFTSKY